MSDSLRPSPGDLPNPGIKPGSPALKADALTSEPPGKWDTNSSLIPKPKFFLFVCFAVVFGGRFLVSATLVWLAGS